MEQQRDIIKAKRVIIDVKTGKVKEEEFDFVPTPQTSLLKGLDLEKLKEVLVKKGIITDKEEVED